VQCKKRIALGGLHYASVARVGGVETVEKNLIW